MTSPALPYDEPAPLAEVYADALTLAEVYPVSRLPRPEVADLATTELGWQRLTDDISAERGLAGPYDD